MEEEEEIVSDPIDLTKIDVVKAPAKVDIYQHIKLGMKNPENCKCSNNSDSLFYCIPCKTSCCKKCNLIEHKDHLLINKNDYIIDLNHVKSVFEEMENELASNDFFKDYNSKCNELTTNLNKTYEEIINKAKIWKEQKLKELNDMIEELKRRVKELKTKKEEIKKLLIKYKDKNRLFLNMGNKNRDNYNTVFLMNYDLLNLPHIWSKEMKELMRNIERNFKEYQTRENKRYSFILKNESDVLFPPEDENFDFDTHEKLDAKDIPLRKYYLNLQKLDPLPLGDVEKRTTRFSKAIDTFRKVVYTSVQNHGNYKDIAKENLAFESKVKGAENLFSQRKITSSHVLKVDGDNVLPGKPITNKKDIILDNPVLIKYFSHVMTNIYESEFKMNTKELQSSHADLKVKNDEEEENDVGKIIEGTNQILIYDKKLNQKIRKTLKLTKNPHGYSKFPFGCRSKLLGDKFYITGGKDETQNYANVLIYDRKTEQIKRIMDMQYARSYHTLVFSETFETLMVFGGENCSAVEIFDPLSNRWQVLPPLNVPRANPLFYFDEPRGNIFCMFGNEGYFINGTYSDCIEYLDLTNIRQGWIKLNYNNKVNMDFKCYLNIFPLNNEVLLIYGGKENRDSRRNVCAFNILKSEMVKIEKNLMEEIRREARSSRRLSYIVSAVTGNTTINTGSIIE